MKKYFGLIIITLAMNTALCSAVPKRAALPQKSEQELIDAAERGDLASVNRLIKAGVNVNAKDYTGWSALKFAADREHVAIVKRLLAVPGIEVDSRANNRDYTPLIVAALENNIPILKVLLTKGANINARGVFGMTALMWAAHHGNEDLVNVLLTAGADTNIQDNKGKTAYDIAMDKGHPKTAKLIKQ